MSKNGQLIKDVEGFIKIFVTNVTGRHHLEDSGANWRITQKWILRDIQCESCILISNSYNTIQSWALVCMVMKIQGS
jgi:hypothetical protein